MEGTGLGRRTESPGPRGPDPARRSRPGSDSFRPRPPPGRPKKVIVPEVMSPPPLGGQYSCSLVSLFLDLYLQTGASLRCVADTFAVIVRHFRLAIPAPSFTTIRAWVLRLGCYSNSRSPENQVERKR